MKDKIKDGLRILKHAHEYYDKVDECEEIKDQIKCVFSKYKKCLTQKRIPKKRYSELKSYIDAINTFKKLEIYSVGEELL